MMLAMTMPGMIVSIAEVGRPKMLADNCPVNYSGGVVYVDAKKGNYRVYLTKGDRVDRTVSFKKDCLKSGMFAAA